MFKTQKAASFVAPVGASKEDLKVLEKFQKDVAELQKFMVEHNITAMVQHNIIFVPKPNAQPTEK
jgi:hypothetical protein